jgi:hypothetical protein
VRRASPRTESERPADRGSRAFQRLHALEWTPLEPCRSAREETPLPGLEEAVGFEEHVKPLFRERNRTSMKFAFDLWSYDDVSANADGILERLHNGSMPCDGAWPRRRSLSLSAG